VRDVAKNLERFVDAIMARTGPHQVVVELATQAGVPVINGRRSASTRARRSRTCSRSMSGSASCAGCRLAFVGDGNNVYHSLALLGATMGMEIRLAHPEGYEPN
jgi:ornithine carbamoyltransferase